MANFKLPDLKQSSAKAKHFEDGAHRHSTTGTVRITVDLDAELHRRLKVKAAMEGKRMADLVRQWVSDNTENFS